MQHVKVITPFAEIVLAVPFEPADCGFGIEQRAVMGCAQPDADALRNGFCFWNVKQTHAGLRPAPAQARLVPMNNASELFLEREFAAELLAGAFCHVIPFFRRLVGRGLSGTRMGSGCIGAIVLTGFGDAVAFFFARGFVRGKAIACRRHGDKPGKCGTHDKLLVHVMPSLSWIKTEKRYYVGICPAISDASRKVAATLDTVRPRYRMQHVRAHHNSKNSVLASSTATSYCGHFRCNSATWSCVSMLSRLPRNIR